jgi:hypothetical protein
MKGNRIHVFSASRYWRRQLKALVGVSIPEVCLPGICTRLRTSVYPALFELYIPFNAMARSSSQVLLLLLWATDIDGRPLRPALTHRSGKASTQDTTVGWSNEAIFTLIGVCIAALGILIGLLSSPKLRQWLCKPLKCKQQIQLASSP